MALGLLNKYQKDRNFIQKEVDDVKRRKELYSFPEALEVAQKPKGPNLDPISVQEERHREVYEKRQKRLERQTSKGP